MSWKIPLRKSVLTFIPGDGQASLNMVTFRFLSWRHWLSSSARGFEVLANSSPRPRHISWLWVKAWATSLASWEFEWLTLMEQLNRSSQRSGSWFWRVQRDDWGLMLVIFFVWARQQRFLCCCSCDHIEKHKLGNTKRGREINLVVRHSSSEGHLPNVSKCRFTPRQLYCNLIGVLHWGSISSPTAIKRLLIGDVNRRLLIKN
jgi:hypothetical protein